MGTNYYAVKNRPTVSDPIHIGKSSMGWMFHFEDQYQPWNEIPVVWHTYNQVIDWLQKHTVDNNEYVIINEYDDIVTLDELKELIALKQEQDKGNPDNFSYHVKNIDGYRFSSGEFS